VLSSRKAKCIFESELASEDVRIRERSTRLIFPFKTSFSMCERIVPSVKFRNSEICLTFFPSFHNNKVSE